MNSILANNDESDCLVGAGGGTVSANFSLISDGSCGITNGVNGNIVSEAFFDPNGLQNNGGLTQTLALSPASPGVNAGSNTYRMEGNAAVNTDFNGDGDKADTLSTDQRGTGFARTFGGTVDMGAFETNTVFTGLTVDTTSDAILYSCTNAANDCSLRGAILLANGRAGTDTIGFASTVFSGTQTITLDSSLPTITSNILMNGPGLTTTISGNNAYRHFMIDNGGSLTINGLTISNGYNGAEIGGAFYVKNGTLNLSNSSIESNISQYEGGAIYVGTGSLTIANSSFSNNFSNISGGAIFVYNNGTLRVTDSTFSNNSTVNTGGAIFSETSIFIAGSTFSVNTAGTGAGIHTNGGTVFNSTFANNISGGQGGAIDNDAALSLSLINVTLSNNSANGGMGGQVFIRGTQHSLS
jgi:predicted outer membrane repeat protein